jgi:rSAM/selenodomain-associated transferase 2
VAGTTRRGTPAACYRAAVKIAVVIPALDEAEEIEGAMASVSAGMDPGEAGAEAGPKREPERERRGVSKNEPGTESPKERGEESEPGVATGLAGEPIEVELLVVDGGSRDGTLERARAAGARVIETAPGRARQLRAGVDASKGEVVLFLHADTRLPPGWRQALGSALEDPGVSGGAFGLRFDERRLSIRLLEWGARLRAEWLGLPYGDQAIFVRRRLLDRIGGVPEAPVMEDLDLVQAIRAQGTLALLPLCVTTSARRYLERGVWGTTMRHNMALIAWWLGLDRSRVARWMSR